MTHSLNIINVILDYLILLLLIIYSILFYYEFKFNILSYLIIAISALALSMKLLKWHTISNKRYSTNKSHLFILKIICCTFLYILPPYYIIQSLSLVVSQFVISITLIIVSLLIFSGILIEKNLIKYK